MKIWLKENWFKLAGLLVVLVIGLAYIVYLNTKETNQRMAESRKELQAKIENEQKLDAENKKYLADRKADCLEIYTTENNKWGNVSGWRFDDEDDSCYIKYKESEPKTKEQCDEIYKGDDGKIPVFFYRLHSLCRAGEFENSF